MKYPLLPLIVAFAMIPLAANEVNLVKLHVDSFKVVGIEARTSNAQEMSGSGVIGSMWARLRSENLLSQIQRRVDSRIYAVYSNYESDKDGAYNYLLGAKVSSTKGVPPGMVWRAVASGSYGMFTAQGGPPAQLTVSLWKRIWSLEKPGPLHRAYNTDFEVHYEGLSEDPANAHVDIYIGLTER